MAVSQYEEKLKGGHPNSLGNTLDVVEHVLGDRSHVQELINTWKSDDEVVRLRVQNAVRRVAKEQPEWIFAHIDDLQGWIADIDQASTKWVLSILFMWFDDKMDAAQRQRAIEVMKNNLHYDDWIVQNNTIESLTHFAKKDEKLKEWLVPELQTLTRSRHKSVAKRANKYLDQLI